MTRNVMFVITLIVILYNFDILLCADAKYSECPTGTTTVSVPEDLYMVMVESLRNRVSGQGSDQNSSQSTQCNNTAAGDTSVGFTVQLHASTHSTTVSPEQVMPFSHVINSYGGGFNPSNGVFSCPVSGMYMISASIVSSQEDLWIDIKKDGTNIGAIYKDNHNTWDSGTSVAIVRLSVGNEVWLQTRRTAVIYRQSQFSAARISA